jgi:hypothetical protein
VQEEVALSLVVSAAIVWLLLSLRAATAQDYIFACFFLICTTSLLKIRRGVHPSLISWYLT